MDGLAYQLQTYVASSYIPVFRWVQAVQLVLEDPAVHYYQVHRGHLSLQGNQVVPQGRRCQGDQHHQAHQHHPGINGAKLE